MVNFAFDWRMLQLNRLTCQSLERDINQLMAQANRTIIEPLELPTGGIVRIKVEHWALIQELAVELSRELGRPVKESQVIHFVLGSYLTSDEIEKLAKRLAAD